MKSGKLLQLSISLMIALSVIYIVVICNELLEEEFEEILEEPLGLAEMILFSVASVLYAIFAVWLYRSNSKLPIVITIIGTVALIVLYGIAISDLSEPVLGMSPEEIEKEAIIAKVLQVSIVVVLFVRLRLFQRILN